MSLFRLSILINVIILIVILINVIKLIVILINVINLIVILINVILSIILIIHLLLSAVRLSVILLNITGTVCNFLSAFCHSVECRGAVNGSLNFEIALLDSFLQKNLFLIFIFLLFPPGSNPTKLYCL
jgi:hypothetical protein